MSMVVKNTDDLEDLDEAELEELYSWVDKIPLSRPKRNIARDFSDGVMIAELIKHFLPHIVSLHNYTPGNATKMKLDNWRLLNRKVFNKLNFQLTEDLIRELCLGKQGLIERFLMHVRAKIERAMWDMQKDAGDRTEVAHHQTKASVRLTNTKPPKSKHVDDKPEADQNINMQNNTYSHIERNNYRTEVSPGRTKPVAAPPPKGHVKIKQSDDLVPKAIYEEREQECLAKEETIQILQAKIRRLEHLLHLKDVRIEELQGRLESIRPTGKGKR
ncbi:sperm flagellar protein 1-like isoform X2 [Physella acuta]|uniref:sperm flagellar protein 1-like isoform X2 n=1 Tax=Physella acuta TaxID=109671 RepID=UPI0027DC38E9|nr:sperm flagellar protein 1-like isoform X2 [Physella acuta]